MKTLLYSGSEYVYEKTFCADNGIPQVPSIYQYLFVKNDGLTIDFDLLKTNINRLMPGKNDYGFAMLDWEGYIYDALTQNISITDTTLQRYCDQYISALNYAKILRPNYKWGYYSIPRRIYADYDNSKRDIYFKYTIPLLNEIDYLSPSIYVFYTGESISEQFISSFHTATLQFALDWGHKLNKPVYPYVWHRYHPNSDTNGNLLIDNTSFGQLIELIMNTEVFGVKAAGLLWWNSEYFNYQGRAGNAALTAEYVGVTDPIAYITSILNRYRIIIQPFMI